LNDINDSGEVGGFWVDHHGRFHGLQGFVPEPNSIALFGGIPKHDLAAELARAIFEEDPDAIKAAFTRMLHKGSPYAFQVLADRAYGKLKESVALELGPIAI